MKTIVSLLLIFSSISVFSQVYGDLFMDKRAIEKDIDYTISYSKPGKIVFDVVVDRDGKVTSCVLNEQKSTLTTTGAVMKAKNKIIMHLQFAKGFQWPQFHRGYIQINTIQDGKKDDDKFSPPSE